jgi:hypothetical protein
MAANGKRIAALDNSEQFNRGRMREVMPVDASTPTDPWIHDEHHIGRRRVSVDSLIATQERYNPDKVKGMAKRKTTMPMVVFTDAGPLVHDGHHRVLSALRNGARFINVDAYDGRQG